MTQEFSVVGKRLPHWAAQDKATGAAKYTADIKLPNMLVGRVLPSPHAHALIKKIDKSAAEKLPGVEAVITWEDIPHKLFNPNIQDITLHMPQAVIKDAYIISEKARFVGDVIGAVAALDEATAERALGLIHVEYETQPAVFEIAEAMQPGAPLIHDFAKNNISMHMNFPVAWGNVQDGFEQADVRVEATFRTSKQHTAQLEPLSCIAQFDASGRLTVWSPNQRFFIVRSKLAELFDIPEGKIRVISHHLGGGFGKMADMGAEPICVALAKKSGKAVKLEYSREEDLFGTWTREAYIESGKLGARRDGTLTALSMNILVHSGAYFNRSSATAIVTMGSFTGLYRCPNVAAEMTSVYTNTPCSGGSRGYGVPEAYYLLEQLVDTAAEKIGMDPVEMRLKNLKQLGDPGLVGLPLETSTQEKCIRLGAEKIGWQEKRSRKKEDGNLRRGIGMATYLDVSGGQPFDIQDRNIEIKINEDGSANLYIGISDIGQNLLGASAQIAAEVMGLRYEDIHIIYGDTDTCSFDAGTYANSGCYQIGNAVMKAADEVKKLILERAAGKLGTTPDQLNIRDRRVLVKDDPSKGVSIGEISKDCIYNHAGQHLNIFGKASFSPAMNPYPAGAVFADVEVDTETGGVKVARLLLVHDAGRLINPATVEGQLQGAMALGIGYTLFEDYSINPRTGVLESDNYNTYKLPTTLDLPELGLELVEEPTPSGPFGAKGVGMSGIMGIPAAIANAIYHACGVRIKDMPLTPERVLKALEEKVGF
jgi:xanthine dehydrogenase molybdenum-binding subunit